MVGYLKFLLKRQSDGSSQSELCDVEIVARDTQVVLLRMKLNLCASRFDARIGACLVFPIRLIVERLRVAYLSLLRFDS